MASPALTIGGRTEQAVHDLLEGSGGFVGEEVGGLFGRRREAGEVVGSAANQCASAGVGVGVEADGLELRQDEMVHRRRRPSGLFHLGYGWVRNRLVGPEPSRCIEIDGRL